MGDVIQFVPKPNPNRETLEQQAVGLVGFLNGLTAIDASQAGYPVTTEPLGDEFSKVLYNNLPELYARSETVPYGGQGIDGMTFKDPA